MIPSLLSMSLISIFAMQLLPSFPLDFPSPPGLAFFGIKILAKFDPTVEKLIKFTLEKPRKIQNFLNIFVKKWKHLTKNCTTDHNLIGFI